MQNYGIDLRITSDVIFLCLQLFFLFNRGNFKIYNLSYVHIFPKENKFRRNTEPERISRQKNSLQSEIELVTLRLGYRSATYQINIFFTEHKFVKHSTVLGPKGSKPKLQLGFLCINTTSGGKKDRCRNIMDR